MSSTSVRRMVAALGLAAACAQQGSAIAHGAELPPEWSTVDIGKANMPGRTEYDPAERSFKIYGSGYTTSYHYAFTKFTGDFVATCRATALSGPKLCAAGLMVRAYNEPRSRFALNGCNQREGVSGGGLKPIDGDEGTMPGQSAGIINVGMPGGPPLPVWLRIVRYANRITCYDSADGKTWNLQWNGGVNFAPEQPGLPYTLSVGLAISQRDSSGLEWAVFDNVSIEPLPRQPYVTSWLGNTWSGNYSFGHVQMQVTALTFDRVSGLLHTNGLNEALDQAVYDDDGNLLHTYQLRDGCGHAIACDGNYVYADYYRGKQCIVRRQQQTAGPSSRELDSQVLPNVWGLAAGGGKVYVSCDDNSVRILNKNTMAQEKAFDFKRPGALALAADETLWIAQRPAEQNRTAVLHYTAEGEPIAGASLAFSRAAHAVDPSDIAISPIDGRIFVSDIGRNQCVWIFGRNGRSAGRLGEFSGIYDGIPGQMGPDKLLFPRALALDSTGNTYVAMCPRIGWVGGNIMRKYDRRGSLVWERCGQEFQECADLDPQTGIDVYTQQYHYTMDFSKDPGGEAKCVGMTFDPFTYPKDTRNTLNGGAVNAASVRRIAGRRILFLHKWPRSGECIYRFEGKSEIAIPCGRVGNGDFWMDVDGDGQPDPDEVKDGVAFGICWTVDSNGDIWSVGGTTVRCWRNQGLNAHGVPVFTREPTETHQAPQPYTDVHYVVYDAATDALFTGGYTADLQKDAHEHGGALGQWLSRYNSVRAKGRLAEAQWSRTLPYHAGREGLGHETNCFFSAAYAGDKREGYLFIGGLTERGMQKQSVWAIDAATGKHVETFLPGPEVAGYGSWLDFNNAINAAKRSNGEYLIFVEDDGAQKVLMYRWRPSPKQ